ncbi:MAG: 4-(cytidine 5'-diphospho)-2-C-methyl-D-erythritol kinase [Defluviitaleaceae bacterium]|nr:4-(cytidine 5'-diphospho)-2-C-methyl-D-erythritol kinase [Defluviitaleaceae bacterium]
MDEITVKARAKINLSLDVLGKREDGYHEISTVMQSLSLFDTIEIKKINKPNYGIKLITGDNNWLPVDDKNLIYKAADYLKKAFNIETGVFINLTKMIPISAGLGGGSADGAATLIAMRDLFNLPLTNDDLVGIAANFGADVPFCVYGGTALATGIGDILTPLPCPPFAYVVLVKQYIIISTTEVFAELNLEDITHRPDTNKIVHHIQNGDLRSVCGEMVNVLDTVTIARNPQITDVKEALLANGAIGAAMSGSGPTVFGIFETRFMAEKAIEVIKDKFEDIEDIILTKFEARRS